MRCKVPQDLVDDWKKEGSGKTQVIGQAELLPVAMVRSCMSHQFKHRGVFGFVDNDSARMALCRGTSESAGSNRIISYMTRVELYDQAWTWFARIPSESNPSDGPSRLRLSPGVENLFAKLVVPPEIPCDVYAPKGMG